MCQPYTTGKKKLVPNFGTQYLAIWQSVGCLLFKASRALVLKRMIFTAVSKREAVSQDADFLYRKSIGIGKLKHMIPKRHSWKKYIYR